jgi:hypothetical protein
VGTCTACRVGWKDRGAEHIICEILAYGDNGPEKAYCKVDATAAPARLCGRRAVR